VLPLKRIRGWSGDAQFTLVAAVALIIGALAPWLSFGDEVGISDWASGIETNAGFLCLVAGVGAIWLLHLPGGPRAAAESGALAGVALIAGALVLVTLIRHWDDPASPMWGLYLSGLAALAMLVGSFVILGEADDTLPPPD
jgi:peptidoglycan/LPS O-acetylase OafA/YrhL